jgi:UDP-N-acetylglucosamine acyltransferase
MASSHIGHDSVVGNRVIFANAVLVGGHCHIESFANIAGAVAVAQFVTVGKYSFICGTCGVRKDAEPFIAHDKVPPGEAGATCINEVGLRRNGFSRETIQKLRTAFKLLFLKDEATLDLVKVRAEIQAREAACQEVEDLLAFVERKRKGRFGRQLQ